MLRQLKNLLPAIALALLTAAVFLPAIRGQFVWDDGQYVSENRFIRGGLSLRGVAWAFTSFYASNWHPLTWISHMADVSLFGMNPAGHHAVNVLLHAVNAALLFLVLRAATGARWRSLAVAALFALHPLRVQSVAWVAERKDVLSAFFFLAALASYVRFVRRPGPRRSLAVAACFALALLAKPMAVTLPFVLLLLDFWPLGRLREGVQGSPPRAGSGRAAFVEKLPLFALSIAAGALTLLAQRSGGSVRSLEQYPFWLRCANALEASCAYLAKALWPAGLSATYPHPGAGLPLWPALLALVFLAAVTLLVIAGRCSRPYLLAGWFWYLGMLVPVSGLVQVGGQAMADRYTYLPLIGFALAAVWGADGLTRGRAPAAAALGVALLAALAGSSIATRAAIGYWRDDLTLFGRAIELRPNALAHTNLGIALARRGDVPAAIANYQAALGLRPGDANTWYNLGRAHTRLKDWPAAVPALQRSVELNPVAAAWSELGIALMNLKRHDEAERAFRNALGLDPELAGAYFNLAFLHLGRGDRAAARQVLGELRRVNPSAARELERYLSPK